MSKYRISNGLFVNPDKDMRMLHEMSLKGYHVDSINALGFYRFVEGPPEDYVYSLNFEVNLRDDFLDFYRESGWTPVIVQEGLQIFRAPNGTTPIFTDNDTKVELIRKHKGTLLRLTIATFLILALFTAIASALDFGLWGYVVWTALWIPFVFCLIPLIGLVRAERMCRMD